MKIYSWGALLGGILCLAIPILLLAHDEPLWQLIVPALTGVRLLHIALSRKHSEQNRRHGEAWDRAKARDRFFLLKVNLPFLLIAVFFAAALLLRFAFEIFLPNIVYVLFVIALLLCAFYSIGIMREVNHSADDGSDASR